MRWLIAAVLVVALAWAGYWLWASRAMETRLSAWIAARRAAGWEAGHDGLSVTGFPNRVDVTLSAPHLAPPGGGWRWQAPWLRLYALSYLPGRAILLWPGRQSLRVGGRDITITAEDMRASARLALARGGALSRLIWVAEAPAARSRGWQVSADQMRVALERQPDGAARYRLGLALSGLSGVAGLPGEVTLDGEADLAAPLRPDAKLPALGRLAISELTMRWPDGARLTATGTLRADARGRAEGRIDLTLHEARAILDTPALALWPGLSRGLRAAVSASAGPVSISLSFRAGQVWLGPVPIARAPVLAPQGSNR